MSCIAVVGNHLEVVVSDDGRGIDPDRIFRKAVEKGVVAAGYRAVVALVAVGDVAGAKALEAALAPRLGA